MSRLFECPQCGKKFTSLRELTAEDIQREKQPPWGFQFVCEECHAKIRSISRLEPQYSFGKAIGDALVIVPISSVLLTLAPAIVAFAVNLTIMNMSRLSIILGGAVVLAGLGTVWQRLRNRYAVTHDLRWSVNSQPVLIALAVVSAGIISLIVSNYFYMGS